MDEHRIGLKPITRGVWAPKGERPISLGHHRYEWEGRNPEALAQLIDP